MKNITDDDMIMREVIEETIETTGKEKETIEMTVGAIFQEKTTSERHPNVCY